MHGSGRLMVIGPVRTIARPAMLAMVMLALLAASTGVFALSVVVPPDCPEERLAVAADLAATLERMTGEPAPVVTAAAAPERPGILLGDEFAPEALHANLTPERIGYDGYVIRSLDDDTLLLCGRNEAGHANAAYGWLRALGCRWLMPGPHGEVIPRVPRPALAGWDEVEKPAWVHRQLWYSALKRAREESPDEFEAASTELAQWQRRNRMGQGVPVRFGHSFLHVVPPERYFDAHPEYFAEREGQRVSDGQLCTTNEDVIGIFADAAIAAFDENPELQSFSLSPNDGAGWCHCANCEALDPPDARGTEKGKADRVVTFVNAVARRVMPQHPDRWLAFYAYAGCVAPPTYADPDDNVLVVLAHYIMDSLRPITDPASRWNATFKDYVDGWGAVSEQMFLREYYCRYWAAWPMWPAVAADIPYLSTRNFNGFNAELEYRAEGAEIGWYLLGQLCWDPEQDPAGLLAEYFAGLYGPAAEDMRAYFEILREAAADPRLRSRGGLDETPELFPPERIARASERLAIALPKATTEAQRFQVQRSIDAMAMMRAYYELTVLLQGVGGTLEEPARIAMATAQQDALAALERIRASDPARYWSVQQEGGGMRTLLEASALVLGQTALDPWDGQFRTDSFAHKAMSLARMVLADGLSWSGSVDDGYIYSSGTTAAWYVRAAAPIARCTVQALTYDSDEPAGWLEWRVSFDRCATWQTVERVDHNTWERRTVDLSALVAGREDFVLGAYFAPGANTRARLSSIAIAVE